MRHHLQDNRDRASHKVKILIYHPKWPKTTTNDPNSQIQPLGEMNGEVFCQPFAWPENGYARGQNFKTTRFIYVVFTSFFSIVICNNSDIVYWTA